MKMRKVTIDDINRALQKIRNSIDRIDNYIFITTDIIEPATTALRINVVRINTFMYLNYEVFR
jgi:hypothetical protein